ncbi:MAG: hypothetical protein ABIF87_05880 [Pseudomonadota bacterium]
MELKIKTDADGLKAFKGLHVRHIPKGPDVLIISTPRKNLNFKTTFTPRPGAGQDLCCIIAGGIITLAGMDMKPEEWRAFIEKLTTRNARIMEKSATEKHIEKTLKAQRAASEKKRLVYEKSGDPEIVIKYILSDFSSETLKEAWVVDVLATWRREDRKDLLDRIWHPKGRPETPYSEKLENLIFVDRIDSYKAEFISINKTKRGSLRAAIITEMQRLAGGELPEVDERAFQKLKSRYENQKKIPTLERVIERPDHYEIILYASKVTLGERPIARGTMKHKFPKK